MYFITAKRGKGDDQYCTLFMGKEQESNKPVLDYCKKGKLILHYLYKWRNMGKYIMKCNVSKPYYWMVNDYEYFINEKSGGK